MSRPSQNIDKKLIAIGKKRMIEQGIAKLSIRSICIESKVNLGMFYYYFKTKENYIKILLETLTNDLHAYWIKESEGLSSAPEKLKRVLYLNAKMMKEKRGAFETIVKDVDFSNDFYKNIAKGLHKQFGEFFLNLIKDCKQEGYLDKNISNEILTAVIIGGVMMYSKHCVNICDDNAIYAKMEEMINLLFEKFK
ncbi:TetR/AcrR family transcriptional regulator [Endomicrobium proavitum]|uniref:HTH tetR-type domain-containing protein n=1 Tax=Endomicrobium proavitum TaxID=1408281 RepID=A0A0G3WKT0_9BACT|nr:TetR/AcrR family transcriptional regulator [Endomicrobium proavitum]AKL98094.1 hypothetical protein Epro_0715 [Endomicrobium proavitum]